MGGKPNGRARTRAPLPRGTFDTALAGSDDPLVGEVVDGRYEIQQLIGAGGMGRVYRARQLRLDRPVALKVLGQGLGIDPALRERFFLEASLTSKLKHPNTVTVFDYGCTENDELYIAMELLEGKTLSDLIDESGALSWWQALVIGQQIGRALREAHQLGVVHRDVKPANVMLLSGDEGVPQVKVLDFGLVKSFLRDRPLGARAMTETGMVMGSPEYVAPEQAEHNAADPRSDVYSLGVVLYEMLSGAPPFRGRYDIDVLLKHVREEVPPLEASAGPVPIPAPVRALVMRCLEKRPEDRFASMDELLVAIAEAGGPPLATPGHGMQGVPAKRLGDALPAIFFLLAAMLGVAAASVALWRADKSAPVQPVVKEIAAPQPAPPPPPIEPPIPETAQSAAPEPPPEPRRVRFQVRSEPSGAQVQQDGVILGTTPLQLEELPGEDGVAHAELLLTLPGYLPHLINAQGEGPTVELLETLEKEPPKKRGERPKKSPASSNASRLGGEEEPATLEAPPPFETQVPTLPPPNSEEIRRLEGSP